MQNNVTVKFISPAATDPFGEMGKEIGRMSYDSSPRLAMRNQIAGAARAMNYL